LSKEEQWRSGTKEERLATLDGPGRPSMPLVHCWRCAPDKRLSRRMECRGTYSCQYVVEVTSCGSWHMSRTVCCLERETRGSRRSLELMASLRHGVHAACQDGLRQQKPPLAPHNPPPMFRDRSAMDTAGCRLCPWAALERNWSAMVLWLGDSCCRLAKMCLVKPLGWGYWSWGA